MRKVSVIVSVKDFTVVECKARTTKGVYINLVGLTGFQYKSVFLLVDKISKYLKANNMYMSYIDQFGVRYYDYIIITQNGEMFRTATEIEWKR